MFTSWYKLRSKLCAKKSRFFGGSLVNLGEKIPMLKISWNFLFLHGFILMLQPTKHSETSFNKVVIFSETNYDALYGGRSS